MSKFLGSLGLCLCVKLWDLNCDVLASLIDDAVPNCKAAVWTCVRGTTRDFDAIRCKLSYLDDVKKERQICRNITGLGRKIDQPLSKFMVSLQVTFELAQEVSKQLNEVGICIDYDFFLSMRFNTSYLIFMFLLKNVLVENIPNGFQQN